MSEELEWVNNFYHSHISENSIQSLYNFVLFWSMLESLVFHNNVTVKKICATVDSLGSKAFNFEQYKAVSEYFKNRYIKDNSPTTHFKNFTFRPKDMKDYVEDVLKKDDHKSIDVVKVLLIIVYRLRNNLFHGLKEIPQIHEQEENFKHANMIIQSFLEDYKKRSI